MLWWVIEPLMYLSVFYIVFTHILKRGDENFVLFLLTGLIVWKWFQSTINTGASSLIQNASLMNQVYLPKIVFPLTAVSINTFKFLIVLFLYLIILQFTPTSFYLSWTLLPVIILCQLLFIIGVTSLLAAIMPFFPDLRMVLDNILMMLLFVSGIFFDVSSMPESVKKIFMLNPMASLIIMYRTIILDGSFPDWNALLAILVFSIFLIFVAIFIFYRFDRIYPKIIH